MRKLDASDRGALFDALAQRGDVVAGWLFGSQAEHGRSEPGDVDLAVLPREAWSLDEQLRFEAKVSRVLGTDAIDVVDLRHAGPVLRYQVVARGSRFFCADESAANAFELLALRAYQDLAPRRRLQWQAIRGGERTRDL